MKPVFSICNCIPCNLRATVMHYKSVHDIFNSLKMSSLTNNHRLQSALKHSSAATHSLPVFQCGTFFSPQVASVSSGNARQKRPVSLALYNWLNFKELSFFISCNFSQKRSITNDFTLKYLASLSAAT